MNREKNNKDKWNVFKEELKAKLLNDMQIEGIDFVEINKNNGIVEEWLCRKMEKNTVVICSVKDLYLHYERTGIDACVRLVLNKSERSQELDVKQFFGTWQEASSRIFPELVNTKWNDALLQRAVSKPFLDLSIVLRLYGKPDAYNRRATMILTKSMWERIWEEPVLEEAVWEAAYKNLEQMRFDMIAVETLLKGLGCIPCDLAQQRKIPAIELYAVRETEDFTYGAVALLRKDFWEQVSAYLDCENLFLIPESTESILVIPDRGEKTAEEVEEVIGQVNEESEEKEFLLSDHLYCYSRRTGKVALAVKSK